jgi:hypothetical protein
MYVLGGEVNFQRQPIAAASAGAAMFASVATTDGINKGQNG